MQAHDGARANASAILRPTVILGSPGAVAERYFVEQMRIQWANSEQPCSTQVTKPSQDPIRFQVKRNPYQTQSCGWFLTKQSHGLHFLLIYEVCYSFPFLSSGRPSSDRAFLSSVWHLYDITQLTYQPISEFGCVLARCFTASFSSCSHNVSAASTQNLICWEVSVYYWIRYLIPQSLSFSQSLPCMHEGWCYVV